MTTTNHLSGLPEQEPTSPAAIVLCGGEAITRGADGHCWESDNYRFHKWSALRSFAANNGGATLYDLVGAPAGLTDAQKEAVREANDWIVQKFPTASSLHAKFQQFFPEVFADGIAELMR